MISKEFRDIPLFCFPGTVLPYIIRSLRTTCIIKDKMSHIIILDLERMKLEKAETATNDFFTFSLTGQDGRQMYGSCLRGLFRGENRRFDVRRRPRHCLCILSKQPNVQLMHGLLLQVMSMSLAELQPGSARVLLESIYQYGLKQPLGKVLSSPETLTVSRIQAPQLLADFNLRTAPPHTRSGGGCPGSSLPLLECLGPEKFLILLSALLCERRVIFIADEPSALLNGIYAAKTALHPFKW